LFPEIIYCSTSSVFTGLDPRVSIEDMKWIYLEPKFNKFLTKFQEKYPEEFLTKNFYIKNKDFNWILERVEKLKKCKIESNPPNPPLKYEKSEFNREL